MTGHNADVPVLLFDVTGIESEAEFFEKCGSGELAALAHGEVKQRPILHFTESSFSIKVASHGTVTDADGQEWAVNAFLKVRESLDAEPVVDQRLSLRLR